MKKPNELQKNKEEPNEQENTINENTTPQLNITENDNKINETVANENNTKEQKKISSTNVRKSLKQKTTPYNLGFEILPDFVNDTRECTLLLLLLHAHGLLILHSPFTRSGAAHICASLPPHPSAS